MVYPDSHPDPKLAGKAKGMKADLKERVSVWQELCHRVAGGEAKVIGKCKFCKMSEQQKDAQHRVALAEEAGQEETLAESDITYSEQPDIEPKSDWCCMHQVLTLQEDFANKTPMIQKYVESRGHICLFYPKFHCELNPMEMVWGFAKYCALFTLLYASGFADRVSGYHAASNGKILTTQKLILQCLDMAETPTIWHFFRKCWHYMDAYS